MNGRFLGLYDLRKGLEAQLMVQADRFGNLGLLENPKVQPFS